MSRQVSSMAELIRSYEGHPVAILCMRYWYRGIVQHVGADFVTLSHARAVEQTGPSANQQATTEDPVPSDIHVKIDVIELVCQPAWVWHEMPVKKESVQ